MEAVTLFELQSSLKEGLADLFPERIRVRALTRNRCGSRPNLLRFRSKPVDIAISSYPRATLEVSLPRRGR